MEKQKMFGRRTFYRDDDSGKMFLISLLTPFVLSFIFSTIAGTIANMNEIKPEVVTSSLGYIVAYSLCQCLVYFAIYLIYNKITKVSFKAINLKFKMPWHTYLILILVGIVSLFGLNYFVGATDNFLQLIGFPINEGLPLFEPNSAGTFILGLLLMAVIPAICEELLFRGVILHGLRFRFSDWGAIFLSGLMFAIMHANLQQFIYPFILGSIMGWLVLRTGSLFSSMLVHFVNNGLVVAFRYIENMTGLTLNLPNVWWFYLLAVGLLLVTIGILWLVERYYFNRKSASEQERASQKTSIYVYISLAVGCFLLLLSTIIAFVSKV